MLNASTRLLKQKTPYNKLEDMGSKDNIAFEDRGAGCVQYFYSNPRRVHLERLTRQS